MFDKYQKGIFFCLKAAMRIPIRYKFLSVLLIIVISALATFFGLVIHSFSEDKAMFILDFNVNVLKATTHELRQEINTRLEYVQSFLPRIYALSQRGDKSFKGYGTTLPDEVLRFSFYKPTGSGKFVRFLQFENQPLLKRHRISKEVLSKLNQQHPLPLNGFYRNQQLTLLNRSMTLEGGHPLPVLTVLIAGAILSENNRIVIAVDFLQDFLIQKLKESDLAEVFLVSKDGRLLSHGDPATVVAYSSMRYSHPILDKIDAGSVKTSVEVKINGQGYLCNVGEAGFGNLLVVSQIRKEEAFLALRMLLLKTFLLAGLVTFGSILVSISFTNRLTHNIEKVGAAAKRLGEGDLEVKLDIESNDEVKDVSRTFGWMVTQIKELLIATENKVRMEQELETARLMQSTILTPPTLASEHIEIASHYTPATECGGDVWDVRLWNNKATIFIGDATGHGAAAALVTTLVKSCFATIGTRQVGRYLPPEQILDVLNTIMYRSCRGHLLMTMALLELDLVTGDLVVANAGHESPFCLRVGLIPTGDVTAGNPVDVLFARGERLGFQPNYPFQAQKYRLTVGDTIVLYTDGVTEAESPKRKEFGERALKRLLKRCTHRSVWDIKAEIESALQGHMAGARPNDDITFMVFKWKKSLTSGKPAPSTSSAPSAPPNTAKAA